MKPVILAMGLLLMARTSLAELSVDAPPPNLPAGFAGAPYSQTLTVSSPFGWSLNAGALPAGLSLSSSGVISGVPTSAGTSIFGLNGGGGALGVFTLTILPFPPRLVITPAALPSACSNVSFGGYSKNLAAGGGVAPYTWSLTSGALPAGLADRQSTRLNSSHL